MKNFNYENKQYLKNLNKLGDSYYSSYINLIKNSLKSKKSNFLDVGCGSGTVLELLKRENFANGHGVDISKLFIREAKAKGIKNVFYYNGQDVPFRNNSFSLVGSFNVLEHIKNPETFLELQVKLLKPKGKLIIICPNFLSSMLFNNWHPRLKGGERKIKNVFEVVKKLIGYKNGFEKIDPIKTKVFKYDSDAILVTNLIDIKKVLKELNCRIIFESGFINYDNFLTKVLNKIPLTRYLSPSCVLVAERINEQI